MKKKIRSFYNLLRYILPIHIIQFLTAWLPNIGLFYSFRGFLLRPFFKNCGCKLKIASGVILHSTKNISLGDNVFISNYVWINGDGGINIGDNVIISPMVVIATTNHVYYDRSIRLESQSKQISIGEGTWIVSHSVITRGVNIGKGCIVAANSTVTKDVKDYTMVGGNPALVIKDLDTLKKENQPINEN